MLAADTSSSVQKQQVLRTGLLSYSRNLIHQDTVHQLSVHRRKSKMACQDTGANTRRPPPLLASRSQHDSAQAYTSRLRHMKPMRSLPVYVSLRVLAARHLERFSQLHRYQQAGTQPTPRPNWSL